MQVRLKKDNYDMKTKLETMLDYYDCSVCFLMSDQ